MSDTVNKREQAESAETRKKKVSGARTLLRSLREFKGATFLTIFMMAMEVVMETLIPYRMATLIDDGLQKGNITVTVVSGLILVAYSIASLFFGIGGSVFGSKAAAGFAKNLRSDMFANIQRFSFSNIDHFSTSSIITRLTTDVSNVQNTFSMATRMAVRTPLMLILSTVMVFLISWKIGLVMLAAIPILVVSMVLLATKVLPVFRRMFKMYDKMNNDVEEDLRGMRVVKSFVRGDFEEKKFTESSKAIHDNSIHAEKIMALLNPILNFSMYGVVLVIAFMGAHFVVGKEGVTSPIMGDVFTTGLLNSVFTYSLQTLSSCMMLSMVFVMLVMSQESMRRISEVLKEAPTLTNPDDPVMEVPDGSISFDMVDFSYSEDAERFALEDVNLEIPSGATVGIIGGTGSSKTTLVQLIPRLYDVIDGAVRVGGVDVRKYDLTALRDAVSVVLQKNELFTGTIKDNLRWGNENATDEEIVEACKAAAADGFISEFPDGYDTEISQGGTNVSGGQKQRLCIARALLKKPKILILDDSTSAVDTATDAKIREAFRTWIPETTKLIIAQRIASVQDCDMIVVMDNGRIVDTGTHEELLERSPIYQEVYTSQKKGGENDG